MDANGGTVPDIDACLAHEVLKSPDEWLGLSSATALEAFLAGAKLRAAATDPSFAAWRIYGPLRDPDFVKRLVARTGRPGLSIGWAMALELTQFAMSDVLVELKGLVEARFAEGSVDRHGVGGLALGEPATFWSSMARRPAMYFGGATGWHLGWYLAGLTKGGDWLGLAAFPRADEIVDAIHQRSMRSYGSAFAGYRVYSHTNGATELLAWAGIEPLAD
ncbi:MAG: hypothetical protein AB7S26_36800 [Sandaracinaceae bacterium]